MYSQYYEDDADSCVFLSPRAHADILAETLDNIDTETGGILIGHKEGRHWYVVEAIDPGPNAVLRHAYFEYNNEYVTHLANKVRRKYKTPPRLLGLWHRHPGSFDRFSSTDDETNAKFVEACGGAAISALVNIDPLFRMTFYAVNGVSVGYSKLRASMDASLFPIRLLYMLEADALLRRIDPVGRGAEVGTEQQICLLEMIDSELPYLEAQRFFEYELTMSAEGAVLTMRSSPRASAAIEFLFTSAHGERRVICGGEAHPFYSGIVADLVSRSLVEPGG